MSSDGALLKDRDWGVIDGDICRVTNFSPLCSFKDGKVVTRDKATPYASVEVEYKKLSAKRVGFICHKVDFIHLWTAFKEKRQDQEVLVIWSRRHYKLWLYKLLSAFMPKMWILLCPEGAFELETDNAYKPELTGEARWKATAPIMEWKPEVME